VPAHRKRALLLPEVPHTRYHAGKDVLIHIGKVLKAARLAQRKSLSEMERQIGVRHATIACLEQGQRWPRDWMKVLHLAQAYGLDLALLFPTNSTSTIAAILVELAACDQEMQQAILALLRTSARRAGCVVDGLVSSDKA
jgi:transcriptional regulator with XRE-family HTH domain